MKPSLILNAGVWFCIGGASVGCGDTMDHAYRQWYMNRIFA